MATLNSIGSNKPIQAAFGGTGLSTITSHGILLGSGTGAITPTAVGATGEILTGVSTADPTWLTVGDAGKVLTAHGAGSAVTWETPTGGSLTINTQTDSYTLVLGDAQKFVRMNKASANNLTVPLNSSVAFPTGTQVLVQQVGAGVTTIVATGGVTIHSAGSLMDLFTQYSVASLVKTDTDQWELFGDLG